MSDIVDVDMAVEIGLHEVLKTHGLKIKIEESPRVGWYAKVESDRGRVYTLEPSFRGPYSKHDLRLQIYNDMKSDTLDEAVKVALKEAARELSGKTFYIQQRFWQRDICIDLSRTRVVVR